MGNQNDYIPFRGSTELPVFMESSTAEEQIRASSQKSENERWQVLEDIKNTTQEIQSDNTMSQAAATAKGFGKWDEYIIGSTSGSSNEGSEPLKAQLNNGGMIPSQPEVALMSASSTSSFQNQTDKFYGMTEEEFSKELDDFYLTITDSDYSKKGETFLDSMIGVMGEFKLIKTSGIDRLESMGIFEAEKLIDNETGEQKKISDYVSNSMQPSMRCVSLLSECLIERHKIEEMIEDCKERIITYSSQGPEKYVVKTIDYPAEYEYGEIIRDAYSEEKKVINDKWTIWKEKMDLLNNELSGLEKQLSYKNLEADRLLKMINDYETVNI